MSAEWRPLAMRPSYAPVWAMLTRDVQVENFLVFDSAVDELAAGLVGHENFPLSEIGGQYCVKEGVG